MLPRRRGPVEELLAARGIRFRRAADGWFVTVGGLSGMVMWDGSWFGARVVLDVEPDLTGALLANAGGGLAGLALDADGRLVRRVLHPVSGFDAAVAGACLDALSGAHGAPADAFPVETPRGPARGTVAGGVLSVSLPLRLPGADPDPWEARRLLSLSDSGAVRYAVGDGAVLAVAAVLDGDAALRFAVDAVSAAAL